jgi:FKBP-type peptidyl-prolyl cis-trans isomerase (trigger factor)
MGKRIFQTVCFVVIAGIILGFLTGFLMEKLHPSVYSVNGGRISAVDVSKVMLPDMDGMTKSQKKSEALLAVTRAAEVFEPSEEMLSSYEENMLAAYDGLREDYNSEDIEEIYTLFSTSEEELRQDADDMLAEDMAAAMVIHEYNLTPSDEEMEETIASLAEEEGLSVEEYTAYYGEEYVNYQVLYDIASEYILSHAKTEETSTESGTDPE